MSERLKHVSKREGVYQYQRRVPKCVQDLPDAFQLFFQSRHLYRKSLSTSHYAKALSAASIAEIEFDGLVAAATGRVRKSADIAFRPSRIIDAAALGDVSQHVRDRIVRSWRSDIVQAEITMAAAESLNARVETAIADQQDSDDPIAAVLGRGSLRELAQSLNVELGFNIDEGSTAFGEIIRAVSDGLVQARTDVQAMLEGKSLPDKASSTLMTEFGANRGATSPGRLFSEVIRDQLSLKNFAPKTVEKAMRAHEHFIGVIGDKPIGAITPQDIHRFLDAVAAREVGKSTGEARAVSRTTVQSYLTQISSPIAFAIGRGWREGPNPASGIKLENWVAISDPMFLPQKRRFEITELNLLFQHPWFEGCQSDSKCYQAGDHSLDDMRYWAPVLALYTGARASELGGLKVAEVKLDSPPHIVLQTNEYRRTKSGKPRVVPILDALLELGFDRYIDRIASLGSDRLFPDWHCPRGRAGDDKDELSRWANGKWIRAFNRTVIPATLGRDPVALRSPVTFHSFRGSFKKLLIDSGGDKKANAIIGHTQDDLDRAYLGHFSAVELHAEFRAANYRGIVIPRR